jgi:NADH-quinone oxidoreductase subunit K
MTVTIPLELGLGLAMGLFVLGLVGVLVRRNIVFILLSIEILLNACGVAFVVVGSFWNQPDGQVMLLFILAMSACEVAVGLGLVVQIYRSYGTLDTTLLNRLRG